MSIGTAKFAVEVQGIQLPEIEVSSQESKIREIKLERIDHAPLKAEFSLIDVFDADEAKAIVRPVLESILNCLALEFDISIGEAQLSNLYLPKDESASSIWVESRFSLRRVVTRQDVTPDDAKLRQLSAKLGVSLKHPALYSAYRAAVNQKDAVTRFMFLYGILLQLVGDNQRDADDFVRKQEPWVHSTPRPDKPKILETTYTRLRNEVGHVRPGASPGQTRSEIENSVTNFQKIVKAALP
jgi:hypothetical protein